LLHACKWKTKDIRKEIDKIGKRNNLRLQTNIIKFPFQSCNKDQTPHCKMNYDYAVINSGISRCHTTTQLNQLLKRRFGIKKTIRLGLPTVSSKRVYRSHVKSIVLEFGLVSLNAEFLIRSLNVHINHSSTSFQ